MRKLPPNRKMGEGIHRGGNTSTSKYKESINSIYQETHIRPQSDRSMLHPIYSQNLMTIPRAMEYVGPLTPIFPITLGNSPV